MKQKEPPSNEKNESNPEDSEENNGSISKVVTLPSAPVEWKLKKDN